jgi:hypothetical protein
MRTAAKLGAVVASGALAIAVPAAAKPPHPVHPSHPATSHKCTAHNVAYVAHGTVVAWGATQTGTPSGTWDGPITVTVKSANHHAKGATSFMLHNTKVRLGKGVTNPPVAGDRVVVIGKITTVAKKCTDKSGAGTITISKVQVLAPKK